ncbi:DUF2272 domain-containing protein [Rhizobium leguminosarum]|uniref:SH3 domain-containing C40 family peptidase n=1 Tax=Rhizobium leguminosarum TaxID=384 RepID=UPI001C9765E6|nr:DUF2272 domain-containing protein [Rhizobium leguminosarum]MBY5539309.1 DUF2272 domain-containing protein [Rhizobium leguminosarum]
MADMYVNVESLNFRENPTSAVDNIIGKLFLTQKVNVVSEEADGWVKCKANLDGSQKTGFVLVKFLREPVSENREKLIASVNKQFMRFERGLGKEHAEPFSGFVGEMWRAIGNNNLDGTDRDVPWSAAAISFMVRKAGDAYQEFKFAAAHSKYIHHAIKARRAGDTSAPFWGFRLNEVRPEIGDIIARDNPEFGPVVNYDVAAALDSYRSHTDIIVQIDSANNRMLAIGGNVSNSVSATEYKLAPGDFASDFGHTFAILKNRTDGLSADA